MPILFGILSSIGIGVSDFLGRFCTRRASATTTVLTALLAGIVTAGVLTAIVPSDFVGRDVALGAASGVTIGFALMLMYRGMAVSSVATVSPLVALFVSVVPLLWDLSTGGSISGTVSLGIVIAIVGVVLASASRGLEGNVRQGLTLAVAAGAIFGVGMTFAGETGTDSGVWPAVAQRTVAFLTLLAYGTSVGERPILARGLRRLGFASGIVGTAGMAMFILGSQRGDLGPAAVSASMFPAVTAVLAYLFDDDQLYWWQSIGIAGALTGVGLIAAG